MDRFWLTQEQFAKIAPHLPTDTRGKERVDDRRVISGIIHVLKSGGRWAESDRGLRAEEDALQSLRALGRKGRVDGSVRGARECRWAARTGADR